MNNWGPRARNQLSNWSRPNKDQFGFCSGGFLCLEILLSYYLLMAVKGLMKKLLDALLNIS